MTAQLVSPEAVAVLLDTEDIGGAENARALVLALLDDAGLSPWADMEIELFPGSEGTLLLARRSDLICEGYRFDDFEELLSAAAACPTEYPAQLFACGGAYYLLLHRPAGREGPEMNEFCLDGTLASGMIAHIREHGRLLIGRQAISLLRKIFI